MKGALENEQKYHTAKLWQIGCFALNNTATNMYMFMMTFVTYYATGIAGMTVTIISIILTAMRAFDAVTDPIVGFIIDKTESRFGKFRPVMLLGNIILAISVLLMFYVTHTLPMSLQVIFFILIHALYIIGYTMQTAVTRAGQTVLTNHPKQRPLFSIFDSTLNIGVFTGGQVFVASYLVVKHGGFTMAFFTEITTIIILAAAVFTVLAMIGIWRKDRKEFFGLAELNVKTRLRDYWPIIKDNRPLQMLVLSASTDKLASQLLRQQPVMVMLFGIILGDYALSGTISLITIIPGLLITFLGVMYARKRDMKSALVNASWLGVISFTLLSVFLLFIDTTSISLENIGFATIVFIVLYSLGKGAMSLIPSIVIPMIPDVADYETYKSGRYIPGMIGTIFSFVDKLVSSLAPALVGFLVAIIGYQNEFPQIGDPLTAPLFAMTIIAAFGIPVLCWLISIIAMNFYKLDAAKMEEIQESIAQTKKEAEDTDEQVR